jgi:hypothetical protein
MHRLFSVTQLARTSDCCYPCDTGRRRCACDWGHRQWEDTGICSPACCKIKDTRGVAVAGEAKAVAISSPAAANSRAVERACIPNAASCQGSTAPRTFITSLPRTTSQHQVRDLFFTRLAKLRSEHRSALV